MEIAEAKINAIRSENDPISDADIAKGRKVALRLGAGLSSSVQAGKLRV